MLRVSRTRTTPQAAGACCLPQFSPGCSQEKLDALVALSVPPAKLFAANMDAPQKKKSMYMWTFQAPLLPELSIAGLTSSNWPCRPRLHRLHLWPLCRSENESPVPSFCSTQLPCYRRYVLQTAVWLEESRCELVVCPTPPPPPLPTHLGPSCGRVSGLESRRPYAHASVSYNCPTVNTLSIAIILLVGKNLRARVTGLQVPSATMT